MNKILKEKCDVNPEALLGIKKTRILEEKVKNKILCIS